MSESAWLPYALFAVAAAGLAATITWALARWPLIVDVPNARSSHVRPTPRGGGLGILIAFAVGLAALQGVAGVSDSSQPGIAGFIVGAAIMGIAGLADDIRTLSFAVKLAAQIVASLLAMAAGVVIEILYVPGFGPVELGGFGYVLTLLWLVGLTNAFNFMDGLDGLAGGTAVIAAGFLCVVAVLAGESTIALLALLIAATSFGFLALNLPPARIFMGDVGSQFLGFAFAVLGVLLARGDTTGTIVFVVPVLLFHFLFDTGFTAARRWRRGENLTTAHRTHLYQLMNQSGLSHSRVALVHYLMAIAQGAAALWLVGAAPAQRWFVIPGVLLIQAGYAALSLRLFSKRSNKIAL